VGRSRSPNDALWQPVLKGVAAVLEKAPPERETSFELFGITFVVAPRETQTPAAEQSPAAGVESADPGRRVG
jgi:hypothetical protein